MRVYCSPWHLSIQPLMTSTSMANRDKRAKDAHIAATNEPFMTKEIGFVRYLNEARAAGPVPARAEKTGLSNYISLAWCISLVDMMRHSNSHVSRTVS